MCATAARRTGRLGLTGLRDFKNIRDDAFAAADGRFETEDRNDDHNDAFVTPTGTR
ncbi:hypothetical protein [Streptomyces albus]|uniref:hypothetical protein n=1 Tax=Streptomyces albus TaxID=1888 RepID=UPI000ACF0A8F|nr:hypothetical protein [Streptomyces albus]